MTTSSTSGTSTQTTQPWSVQQPYLQQAFQQAGSNLTSGTGKTYTGDQVAQFSPEQLALFKGMTSYGSNGAPAATSTNVGQTTATAGAGALTGAFDALGNYQPGGGTDSNIAAATAYANNPATDGMIDATMRDARRSVSEQALPQIARSAATGGNTMSNRRAISEGLVERGLADKTADVSANIRGQQFDNGLKMAEAGRQSDNSAILDALKARLAGGTNAVSTGVNATGSGIQQQGGLFDLANTGAAGSGQQNQQNQIDNAKSVSEYGTDRNNALLDAFYKIVGGNNWGGTSTGAQTQTSTPSTWSTIGSGLGLASSLFKLSDRRLKRDIEQIGVTHNDLPVYTFRYQGDDELHTGLMAQDVEKVRPEAVREFGGIKHVNYEAALS
jgi:hypothetical protein